LKFTSLGSLTSIEVSLRCSAWAIASLRMDRRRFYGRSVSPGRQGDPPGIPTIAKSRAE
jgi:hypothetical protein